MAVSLVILLVITILSVQGLQTTLLQEKMTAAVRDGHIAFEVAEAGLVDAERFIETLVVTTAFNNSGTGGLYELGAAPLDVFASTVWQPTLVRQANAIDGIRAQYFIEELGVVNEEQNVNLETTYGEGSGAGDITGFRVVSRATGKDTNTVRIVVAYYAKRL